MKLYLKSSGSGSSSGLSVAEREGFINTEKKKRCYLVKPTEQALNLQV